MEAIGKRSRILGLAFLIQFVTSFSSGVLVLPAATGEKAFSAPLGISEILAKVVGNEPLVSLTILLELFREAGVVFLGAIMYSTVRKHHEGLALTAFGLYVLEGALIALRMLMLFALLSLGRQFVVAHDPLALEPIAEVAHYLISYALKMLNFVFCVGGTIFYALLFKARMVPRLLSLWGLVSTQGVFVGVVLGLLGKAAPFFLFVGYVPFELVIAIWILVKGTKKEEEE